jgi:hypothetical protein
MRLVLHISYHKVALASRSDCDRWRVIAFLTGDGLVTSEGTRLTVPVSFPFDSALARINEDPSHGSSEAAS